MSQGRIPACVSEPFVGEAGNASGNAVVTGQDASNADIICQQILTKNRCGHSKKSPRVFQAPDNHKRRFPPIEKAKRNFVLAYRHPLAFPIGKIFYNPDSQNKKGGFRRRRSEIREALTCRIGQVLFHYGNLANAALGTIDVRTGKFIPKGIGWLATKAGTSYSQARSALEIFANHHYIEVIERKIKQPDSTYKSIPSIIAINKSFYHDLNITDEALAEYCKKQIATVQRDSLEIKVKDYNVRQARGQKARKTISKLLKKKVDENPGSERKRYVPPSYQSLDRPNAPIKAAPLDDVQTAKAFLADFLNKFKPPT